MPIEVLEHILATNYGWSLEYIDRIPFRKFKIHIGICMIKQRIEKVTQERKASEIAMRQSLRSQAGG